MCKALANIITVMEVMGIGLLTGIAIKSECDRHKAAVALNRKEIELAIVQITEVMLEAENRHLKEKLEKYEKEEKA